MRPATPMGVAANDLEPGEIPEEVGGEGPECSAEGFTCR